MKRLFKNTFGFSMIEGLVATSVVLIAAAGFTSIYSTWSKTSRASRVAALAIEIESTILTGLQDAQNLKTYWNKTTKSYSGFSISRGGNEIASQGKAVFLDTNGKPCGSYNKDTCFLMTEMDIRCDSSASAMLCFGAYRVTVPSSAGVVLKSLGAAPPAGSRDDTVYRAFDSSKDYRFTLTFDVYNKELNPTCLDTANSNFLLLGFNRDDGSLYCARRPETKCPDGQLPKKIVYTSDASGTSGKFELVCDNTQKICCPPNYAFHDFNLATLDQGGSANATCSFVAQTSVPTKEAEKDVNTDSVNGEFCPAYYVTTSTPGCKAKSVSTTDGTYDCSTYSPGACDWDPYVKDYKECPCPADTSKYKINYSYGKSTWSSCGVEYLQQTCKGPPVKQPTIQVDGLILKSDCKFAGTENVPASTTCPAAKVNNPLDQSTSTTASTAAPAATGPTNDPPPPKTSKPSSCQGQPCNSCGNSVCGPSDVCPSGQTGGIQCVGGALALVCVPAPSSSGPGCTSPPPSGPANSCTSGWKCCSKDNVYACASRNIVCP